MTDTPPPRLPLLITLGAATLTAALGISIATVLLPTLTRDLGATVSQVQWVVLAYLMAVTVAIVSAGRLGDLFGHRRVLTLGLVLFIAASAVCALAPTLGVLVAGRAMQGLGGAILIAMPMSLARDLVPAGRLGTAMGVLGTTSAVGTALGPSLGGLLLNWGEWRQAFWLLAGVGGVTLALSVMAIPRGARRARVTVRDLDLTGTLVLVAALSAYALAASGRSAGVWVGAGVLAPAALALFALFFLVERRAAVPLVPMHLLADRRTGSGMVMNVTVGTIMMSTLVVGPFFLAFALNLGAALIGLVMAAGPAVAGLSGVPAGWLTDRLGAARVMIIGLGQIVIGLLCLAILPRVFGVGGYVAALVVLTPAFQLFLAANNTAVLADAPTELRGRLSGLLGLSRNLGLMTGASAMSTLFVALLGTGDAARAAGAEVARAFSMTFTAAAGLALVTLGLALLGQGGGRRSAPDPAE